MATDPPCESLAWDSAHFGLRIARARGDTLDAERAERADEWCLDMGIDCLYLLADADAAETARVAAAQGYRAVDVRLTMKHALAGLDAEPGRSPGPLRLRPAKTEDLVALRPLAAGSHRGTRFYFDGTFPRDRCDALYVSWIERAIEDEARELIVAEVDGRAIGYQAMLRPE